MIRAATKEALSEAALRIRSGELVAFPTETVYGLGANAFDEAAVTGIYKAKGRPSSNPLIVHIARFEDISLVADLKADPIAAQRLNKVKHFWPGPLSVVLPKALNIAPATCAGLQTVAVRIPNHPVALALIREAGVPIAAPSANPANYISPTSAEHVAAQLANSVDFILDGGAASVGLESTIVSLVGKAPRLLRHGAITSEELKLIFPDLETSSSESMSCSTPLAPGMLKEHYTPRTPTKLLAHAATNRSLARTGLIAFSSETPNLQQFAHVQLLSKDGDLVEIASKLFAALRNLDEMGLDLILVDSCPAAGLGAAIMDRLLRATAKYS